MCGINGYDQDNISKSPKNIYMNQEKTKKKKNTIYIPLSTSANLLKDITILLFSKEVWTTCVVTSTC